MKYCGTLVTRKYATAASAIAHNDQVRIFEVEIPSADADGESTVMLILPPGYELPVATLHDATGRFQREAARRTLRSRPPRRFEGGHEGALMGRATHTLCD